LVGPRADYLAGTIDPINHRTCYRKNGQGAVGPRGSATAEPRQDASPMSFVIDILSSLFSFDIVKLSARLDTLEDRKTQILLVLFTMLADSIRFFLVTCIFVLVLY